MSAPCARACAGKQRLQDRLVGVHAGGDVDDGDADAGGCLGTAGDASQPGLCLYQQVVGLAVAIGAFVAVAGDGAAHEARKSLAQGLDGKAELGERAGLEVLDQHVGLGEQRLEQALVVGLGEIGNDRFLAAVEPDVVRALALDDVVVVAGEVALGPLELDHARAGIGEPPGGHRRGDGLVEGDDERAGKRLGHVGAIQTVNANIPSPHSSVGRGLG